MKLEKRRDKVPRNFRLVAIIATVVASATALALYTLHAEFAGSIVWGVATAAFLVLAVLLARFRSS